MKAMVLVLAVALLMACASQDDAEELSTQDMAQAVRDYIEVRGLQEADKISTSSRDHWTELGDRFLLY